MQANLRKELEKCKHPNSRKTKALGKKARRQNNKHKTRLGHAIKSNIMGEKLSWFLGHIDEERTTPLSPQEFEELIELYLHRFDEELQQIALKQSIGKNRANQHAARQDVIRITLERERNEYQSGGMGKSRTDYKLYISIHHITNLLSQNCLTCAIRPNSKC